MLDEEEIYRRPLSDAPVEAGSGRRPERVALTGRTITLEPLDAAAHGVDLFAAAHGDQSTEALWRYMPYGPFADETAYIDWCASSQKSADPFFYAVRDLASGGAVGVTSYLNVHVAQRTIELGHIWFGFGLQRTAGATEAIVLMLRHAFDDLGCRRVEWKCNALNAPSRAAANRFGFRYEGIFYRHLIVKGLNRDTAWYSIVDDEWPVLRAKFDAWLSPANFDAAGRQVRRLADF